MSELDDKLNSILSNPQMMQKIMSLAKSMGSASEQPQTSAQRSESPPPAADIPIDMSLLNKIASVMQRGSVDREEQQLIQALRPYLSAMKLSKLQRAMQAAKMAQVASDVIGVRDAAPPGR